MDTHNLVKMANQIGDFFESMPDRAEALDGIANHLRRFWEPRMRLQILEYVDSLQGADLKEIVVEAINAHRSNLEPHKLKSR